MNIRALKGNLTLEIDTINLMRILIIQPDFTKESKPVTWKYQQRKPSTDNGGEEAIVKWDLCMEGLERSDDLGRIDDGEQEENNDEMRGRWSTRIIKGGLKESPVIGGV